VISTTLFVAKLLDRKECINMNKVYDKETTGLLLVDPYNDFLSPEGKNYPLAKEVAESVNMLEHLKEIVSAVREADIRVFFVPHHRSEPDDFSI
jgi:nicotinamidase-related amidase